MSFSLIKERERESESLNYGRDIYEIARFIMKNLIYYFLLYSSLFTYKKKNIVIMILDN